MIFPSYAPSFKDSPQYSIWGESFLMYIFVIFTTFALATVTMMDSNGSASSTITSSLTSMTPAVELPSVSNVNATPKSGGKKPKRKH
jgi:hypothetical protein